MTAHHKLGASTCERWSECPGSVVLSQHAPQLPPSKYAAQGTAAHEACAKWLQGEPLALGTIIKADGFEFVYSEDDNDGTVCFEHVVTYVEYVESKTVDRMLVEQKVNIPGTDLFGTADAILISPYEFMMVADFKYGKGVRVKAKGNKQLLYYATASYLSLPEVVRQEIPKVGVAIVQPRAGGIDEYWYTPAEIHEFMGWLMAAKAEVERATRDYDGSPDRARISDNDMLMTWGERYLNPGDHCRWCPANPTCPALQTYTVDVISNGDAKIDFINETKVTLPAPDTLPVDVLARIFENGDNVKDYIDKCYSLFNVYAKQGRFDPKDYGLKLVEGIKHRKWECETTVRYELDNLGIPEDDYLTEPKLKSPNQIEKLVGKTHKDQFTAMAYKPQGEISLAPLADKRPAVTYSKPADDFKDEVLEIQLTKSLERETIA